MRAPDLLLAVGRLAAFAAAFGILIQLVLIGRIKWVERSFGLDRLVWLHQKTGLFALGALIAHPILVTAGHALKDRVSLQAQLSNMFASGDGVPLAAAGWLIANTVLATPRQALAGLGIILIGLPIYGYWTRNKRA